MRRATQSVSGNSQSRHQPSEKLKGAADVDAVVAISKAAGFCISADDLTKAQSELSDEELEDVSGGISIIGVCELVCQNKIPNRTLTQIP